MKKKKKLTLNKRKRENKKERERERFEAVFVCYWPVVCFRGFQACFLMLGKVKEPRAKTTRKMRGRESERENDEKKYIMKK